jgi:hypothetical protein
VWQKKFMQCQLCKKHVCFESGKGISSISHCIDFHDNLLCGLDFMDRVELFGIQKSKFKKAEKEQEAHDKLMMKYHKDIGDED